MLTLADARAAFDRYAAREPLLVEGTLYVKEWYEDEFDYLPVWGAREFYVDNKASYARWDQRVIFIDKQTGEVRVELMPEQFEKTDLMTKVSE